jgi:hypothetical protein
VRIASNYIAIRYGAINATRSPIDGIAHFFVPLKSAIEYLMAKALKGGTRISFGCIRRIARLISAAQPHFSCAAFGRRVYWPLGNLST